MLAVAPPASYKIASVQVLKNFVPNKQKKKELSFPDDLDIPGLVSRILSDRSTAPDVADMEYVPSIPYERSESNEPIIPYVDFVRSPLDLLFK